MPSQKLIDVSPGEAITSSVALGVYNEEVPVFADGSNVCIQGAGLCNYPGADLVVELPESIECIVQHNVPNRQAVFVGRTRAWGYNGSSFALLGTFFQTPQRYTLAETWGTQFLVTNDFEVPKFWSLETGQGVMKGLDFKTCLQFIRRQPYVLALRPDGIPGRIAWCSASNIEDWVPSVTNTAGNFDIRDIPGEIKGGCRIGDNVAVYSQNTISIITYVGPPFIFSVTTPIIGFGIFGPKSVCAVDRVNYCLGPQGMFVTDGFSAETIGDAKLREWVLRTIDPNQPERIIVFRNEMLNQIEFRWNSMDGIPRGLLFDPKTGKFSPISLPLSAASERSLFAQGFVADDKKVGLVSRSGSWMGNPIAMTLSTKYLDASTPEMDKLWDTVRLDGQLGNLTLQADVMMFDAYRVQEFEETFYGPLQAERQNYFGFDAQKLRVKLAGTGIWNLSRITIFGEPGGINT